MNIKITVKYTQALNTSNGYAFFSLKSQLCNKGIEYIITQISDSYLCAGVRRSRKPKRTIKIGMRKQKLKLTKAMSENVYLTNIDKEGIDNL